MFKNILKKIIYSYLRKKNLTLINSNNANKIAIVDLLKYVKNNNQKKIIENLYESKSQLAQDLFVLDQLDFMKNGYFVEFGVCDGIYMSNTYILEKKFNWNGIICEPALIYQDQLKKNRHCHIEDKCIFSESNKILQFTEMHEKEISHVDNFNSKGSLFNKKKNYTVKTISLNDLLEKYNCPPNFEYLSIDTEGTEFEIISQFNFKKYSPKIITIEHNYDMTRRESIYKLLIENNYQGIFKDISQWDDWYIFKNNKI